MQDVSGGTVGASDEDVVEVSSTPLEVRELHGLSRCMSCQDQDRKCYVDQKLPQCLYCRMPADCQFRRTVERPMTALSWTEVTGTVAGQKRPHEDGGEHAMNRKLRPIEDHRPSSALLPAADIGIANGRTPHEHQGVNSGWFPPMDNNTNQAPYTVHIKPLNLEPSDARMVRRIPVALPPPPPPPAPALVVKRHSESQDNNRNGSSRAIDPALFCEQCQVHFSTNSEYSKHMSRHTKRFRCDMTGCKKVDGFATLNDLDRHKKSVHGAFDLEDPVWKCFVEGCKSREKIWPRQDNFKAHLERMHRGVDVEHYVKVSDRWLEMEERPNRMAARNHQSQHSQPYSLIQPQSQSQSQAQPDSRPESRDEPSPAAITNPQINDNTTTGTGPSPTPTPIKEEITRRESGRVTRPPSMTS